MSSLIKDGKFMELANELAAFAEYYMGNDIQYFQVELIALILKHREKNREKRK